MEELKLKDIKGTGKDEVRELFKGSLTTTREYVDNALSVNEWGPNTTNDTRGMDSM